MRICLQSRVPIFHFCALRADQRFLVRIHAYNALVRLDLLSAHDQGKVVRVWNAAEGALLWDVGTHVESKETQVLSQPLRFAKLSEKLSSAKTSTWRDYDVVYMTAAHKTKLVIILSQNTGPRCHRMRVRGGGGRRSATSPSTIFSPRHQSFVHDAFSFFFLL